MKKIENLDAMIGLLKMMAEVNRLRILALLCREDLKSPILVLFLSSRNRMFCGIYIYCVR
ncbi:hypothetical protein GCM10023260_06960 [Bartonella acomydis]|uniref:Transcriptional regulator n=1 Tax=Bartonella acomydis TaxID=686234 RepID=A0ABP9MP61_9HYPH